MRPRTGRGRLVDNGAMWRQPGWCRPRPSRRCPPRGVGDHAAGGLMTRTETDRDRLRVERELRGAERVLADLRGVTLDEAAQGLKGHAVLTGTSVIEVACELLAHRPVVRPRV